MLKLLALFLIQVYQDVIRSLLPVSCRFSPSCSEYAKQAILKYGIFKGGLKAIKRIFICQPFSGREGYEPLV